jgi:putative transposase
MKKRVKMRYSSDLTEREWPLIESLTPPEKPGGRPRSHPMREILNAIITG